MTDLREPKTPESRRRTRVGETAKATRNVASGTATAASRDRLAQKDKAPARSPAVPSRDMPKGRQRTTRDVDTAHSNRSPKA